MKKISSKLMSALYYPLKAYELADQTVLRFAYATGRGLIPSFGMALAMPTSFVQLRDNIHRSRHNSQEIFGETNYQRGISALGIGYGLVAGGIVSGIMTEGVYENFSNGGVAWAIPLVTQAISLGYELGRRDNTPPKKQKKRSNK